MRGIGRSPAAGLVLVAAGVLLAATSTGRAARAEAPAEVALVGVAANTGAAVGGHVALRIGDRAYHYEARGDALLVLARETWSAFETRYGVLDNRSLELVPLDLPENAATRIEGHLARLRALQTLHLDRLDALDLERRWVEGLGREGARVELPLLGLYAPAGGDPHVAALRSAVEARHGGALLRAELRAVEAALDADALRVSAPLPEAGAPGGAVQAPLAAQAIAAERLRQRLQLREALRVLLTGRPLAADALVDPEPGAALSDTERVALERFATSLEGSVVRLVRSRRPDRGEPLLLAVARSQAVRRSLEAGRLLLLDVRSETTESVSRQELRRMRPALERRAPLVEASWRERRLTSLAGALDEASYHRLEAAASFVVGFRRARLADSAVRFFREAPGMPARSGPARLAEVRPPAGWRETALASVEANQRRARRALRYGLLRRNCATELARAIVGAFPDAEHAALALGGRFEPGAELSFVPAGLTRAARRHWSVSESTEIPSWRKRRVAELKRREHPAWVALRESNTWTARAYEGSIHDDPFVFFSDGAVLARPFQGAVNLAWGVAHAGLGVLTLPADGGQRAIRGLRGALFSLPELVGVNLRKGGYDLAPLVARAADD